MKKYATISVLKEVKELLEKEKKNRDWSRFLLELYRDAKLYRAKKAFEELKNLLDEKELNEIYRSSKEFRKRFMFR